MSELSPLSLKIWCKGWDEREMRAIEAANIVRCEFCVLINTRHHRYVEEKGRKERSDVMHALSKIIYPGHPKKKKRTRKHDFTWVYRRSSRERTPIISHIQRWRAPGTPPLCKKVLLPPKTYYFAVVQTTVQDLPHPPSPSSACLTSSLELLLFAVRQCCSSVTGLQGRGTRRRPV